MLTFANDQPALVAEVLNTRYRRPCLAILADRHAKEALATQTYPSCCTSEESALGHARFRMKSEPTGRLELPTGGLRSRVDSARTADVSHVLTRLQVPRTAQFRPHCCTRRCTEQQDAKAGTYRDQASHVYES